MDLKNSGEQSRAILALLFPFPTMSQKVSSLGLLKQDCVVNYQMVSNVIKEISCCNTTCKDDTHAAPGIQWKTTCQYVLA